MTTSNLTQALGQPEHAAARDAANRQQPLATSIILHLLPGVALLAFIALMRPVVQAWGFPPTLAASLGILFVLVPLEIVSLLYRGRHVNGRLSLEGVVRYRESTPLWQYVVLAPVLIVWYYQASSAWARLIPAVTAATAGLPWWVTEPLATTDVGAYSTSARLIAAVLAVICSGIVAPIAEELYFRGYLLPRIDRLGIWAVLLNTILFAFQHLWTPLTNPGRVLAWFPIVLVVAWKRNIRLGLIVHLATNLLGVLPLLMVGGG